MSLYLCNHSGTDARPIQVTITAVGVFMAKLFTIPVVPNPNRTRQQRTSDPRYVEGQRLLVEAMKYLLQSDPNSNRQAVELLSEHVRTQFRMTDRPLSERPSL